MKLNTLIILAIACLFVACNCTKKTNSSCATQYVPTYSLVTQKDSASYGLGVLIGENLKRDNLAEEINEKAFFKALHETIANEKHAFGKDSANQILNSYMTKVKERESQGIIDAGKAFLAENGKRATVTTLPSGLQYEVMKVGNGEKPTATSKVKTHYHGTLMDGTVFDSSVDRGAPIDFPVNGVIKGWTEALQLMTVGSKWKLFIPYNLAYGDRGAGASIKPYSTLIFEVELLEIVK